MIFHVSFSPRSEEGQWNLAASIQKKGNKIKIHYNRYKKKLDNWRCDHFDLLNNYFDLVFRNLIFNFMVTQAGAEIN